MHKLLRRLFFHYWYFRQPSWDTGVSPPELFEFIQNQPAGRAIDLGCGTGTNLITLARAGWNVTGVDFAPRAIHLARQKLKKAGVQAELSIHDVTHLRGIHGPFDLALDIGCFHSLAPNDQVKYLEELKRILAPGGYWLMYGFCRADSDHAAPGLLEADLSRIASQLTLVSRRDGHDSTRGRSSAWFLFQKQYPSSQRSIPEQSMNLQNDNIHALREALIYDLTKALGLPQTDLAKSIVRLLFGRAVNAAAEVGNELDCAVAQGGLITAARQGLTHFVKSYRAQGVENIPTHGPLVIASNHPASVDSLVISAFVDRQDYKLIIGEIPFFEHLPNLRQRAIFAPGENNVNGRMRVIRESIRHLRQGGALLIFPYGGIEADPEFMPNPDGEFPHWSRSLEVFTQRVPNLQVLVTIASGVISPAAMRHPITWFRKARPDKQRLAFIYQLAFQVLSGRQVFDLKPRVTFGEIISGISPEHVLADVECAARRTLDRHMEWAHV